MKKLIKLVIFVLLILAFIYLGTKEYHNKIKKNINNDIASDMLLDNETVFIETNHSKVLSKLSSKNNFILYACIDANKLCTKYGLLINDVAKENGINDIFYYDFKNDREENNGTYQKILSKLSDYLMTDDLGNQDLHAPTLIFFKNGLVYSFDDSLSEYRGNFNVDDVWTEEQINIKKTYLTEVMKGFSLNE